ncbi:MAG: hypothetical protein WKG03_17025, partial [Telluria sp.]
FLPIGAEFTMVFQLTTFQGVRYALYNYNTAGSAGGYADFDSVDIDQPLPRGLMRPIPVGQSIHLAAFKTAGAVGNVDGKLALGAPSAFTVKDMGLGRVALQSGKRHVHVAPDGAVSFAGATPGKAHSFQWIETPTGELVLMSLATNRYLRVDGATKTITADSAGPVPDGSDGSRFVWSAVKAR